MATAVARNNILSMDNNCNYNNKPACSPRGMSGGGGAPCFGPRGTLYTHRIAFTSNMAQDPEYVRKPIASSLHGGVNQQQHHHGNGRSRQSQDGRTSVASHRSVYSPHVPGPQPQSQRYTPRQHQQLRREQSSDTRGSSSRDRGYSNGPGVYHSNKPASESSSNCNTPRMEFGRLGKQPRRIDPISWTMPQENSRGNYTPRGSSYREQSVCGTPRYNDGRFPPAGKMTGQFVPTHARTPAAGEYFRGTDDAEHFWRGQESSLSRSPSPLPVDEQHEQVHFAEHQPPYPSPRNVRKYPSPSMHSGVKRNLNLEFVEVEDDRRSNMHQFAGNFQHKTPNNKNNYSFGRSKANLHNMHTSNSDDLVSNSSRISKLSEANLARHDRSMENSPRMETGYSQCDNRSQQQHCVNYNNIQHYTPRGIDMDKYNGHHTRSNYQHDSQQPHFGPTSLVQLKKRSQPWEVTQDIHRTTPRGTPRGSPRGGVTPRGGGQGKIMSQQFYL